MVKAKVTRFTWNGCKECDWCKVLHESDSYNCIVYQLTKCLTKPSRTIFDLHSRLCRVGGWLCNGILHRQIVLISYSNSLISILVYRSVLSLRWTIVDHCFESVLVSRLLASNQFNSSFVTKNSSLYIKEREETGMFAYNER